MLIAFGSDSQSVLLEFALPFLGQLQCTPPLAESPNLPFPKLTLALCLFTLNSSTASLILGLFVFGFVFAINSSIHSFLIIQYADSEAVSMDVGFYYMANAAGRLTGTLLSGLIFQFSGLLACLVGSSIMLALAAYAASKITQKEISVHSTW